MIKSKTSGVHSAPAQIFSSFLSSIIPSRFFVGMAISAGLFSFAAPSVKAAAFTAGNLVVYRVGTGTGNLVNTGNAVFLDEYSPTDHRLPIERKAEA